MREPKDFAIYLINEYRFVDGPFDSIADISPGALYLITEDGDYSLEVHLRSWGDSALVVDQGRTKWWDDYDIDGKEIDAES